MLQREAERNEEILQRNDEELLHKRGLSPMQSHSRGDKQSVGEWHRKRDKRQLPPHRDRKQSLHKERTVFPPPFPPSFPTGGKKGKSEIRRSLKGQSLNTQHFLILEIPLHLKPLVLAKPYSRYLNPCFQKKLKGQICRAASRG